MNPDCSIPVETRLLREINFGIRENLPSHLSAAEARARLASTREIDADSIVDCAESPAEIEKRGEALMKELGLHLQKIHASGRRQSPRKILCVSHGGFIRNVVNKFCRTDIFSLKNCSISVLEICWDSDIDIVAVSPVVLDSVEHLE